MNIGPYSINQALNNQKWGEHQIVNTDRVVVNNSHMNSNTQINPLVNSYRQLADS